MDLLRRYSKHPGLLEDLERTLRRLARAVQAEAQPRKSARSTGRVGKPHALGDRLTAADVRSLVESFRAGVIKSELAKRYGISPKSVQRLLRRFERGDVA